MLITAFTALALFCASANAHFRLQYPEPRGPYVAANEVNFCSGYNDAVSNRSTFPLSGGVFQITTTHPDFTLGVLLSTEQNPNTWESFSQNGTQTFARHFADEESAGAFCIPLDIAAANIPGAVDGANVTIQIVFESEGENLYQCADLTLSSNFTTPSNVTSNCRNETVSSDHDHDHDHDHASDNGSLGKVQQLSGLAAAFSFALVGLAAALI